METIAHPKVTTREEWLAARKALLKREKALTKEYDSINAERRRLPMVKLDKEYVLEGPGGMKKLAEIFDGRKQLIVYHFMFDPSWDTGCSGCTGFVNALGRLTTMAERDTTFVLVSRAPLAKLQKYAAEKGWDLPWYSSLDSDFNYDFHVTLDEKVAPVEYNYKTQAELGDKLEGEMPGLSVFFRVDDDVFHTYSSFARGVERLTDSFDLLDVTPYGRQEDFEDSPEGWPQRPTYG